MDEGLATYFSHRLTDQKLGKNNQLLDYPKGLEWLPNIRREDFRTYGYLSAAAPRRRHAHRAGDARVRPPGQPLRDDLRPRQQGRRHDRGAARAGQHARLHAQRLPQVPVPHPARRRLPAGAGGVHGRAAGTTSSSTGSTARASATGSVEERRGATAIAGRSEGLLHRTKRGREPVRVTVYLKQQGEFNEPTVLGIRLGGRRGYPIRIPIIPRRAGPAAGRDLGGGAFAAPPPSQGRG